MGRPYPAQYVNDGWIHSTGSSTSLSCSGRDVLPWSQSSHGQPPVTPSAGTSFDLSQSYSHTSSELAAHELSRYPLSSDTVIDYGDATSVNPTGSARTSRHSSVRLPTSSNTAHQRLQSLSFAEREDWLRQSEWRFIQRERNRLQGEEEASDLLTADFLSASQPSQSLNETSRSDEIDINGTNEQAYTPIPLADVSPFVNEREAGLPGSTSQTDLHSTNENSVQYHFEAPLPIPSSLSTSPYLAEASRRTPIHRPRSSAVLGELLSRTSRTPASRAGLGRNMENNVTRSPETEEVLMNARHALRTAVGFAERLEEVTQTLTRMTDSATATATLDSEPFAERATDHLDFAQSSGELRAFPRSASISLARSIASLRAASARIDDVIGEAESLSGMRSTAPYTRSENDERNIDSHSPRTESAGLFESVRRTPLNREQESGRNGVQQLLAAESTAASNIRERSRRRIQALSAELSYPYPHERGSIVTRLNAVDTVAAPSATVVVPPMAEEGSSSLASPSAFSHGRLFSTVDEHLQSPYRGESRSNPDVAISSDAILSGSTFNLSSFVDSTMALRTLVSSSDDVTHVAPRSDSRQWRWMKLDRNGDVVEFSSGRGNTNPCSTNTRDLIGR